MGSEAHSQPSEASEDASSYPFLNHSPTTLTNDLPPDVDNKPLARQRRKRTSPEDQAVLEAAYRLDPKPDKNARMKLVEQIALGEKEVQIWFQNRRQTSRRKARPLLPHEIAQFQISRYGKSPLGSIEDEAVSAKGICSEVDANAAAAGHSPSSASSADQKSSEALQADSSQVSVDSVPAPESSDLDETITASTIVRRTMPSLQQILSDTGTSARSIPLNFNGRPLRKASSFVRLSMTSGGNAEVVTKDGISPSPPRQESVSLLNTQLDTHTARNDAADETTPASSASSLKRSLSGRSRDSRAWEFWCDKECRTELTDKAEKDGNGSAADAIGVIRASSHRRILHPLPQNHVGLTNRQHLLPARRLIDGKRPPLQRAHTSNGRLQHLDPRSRPAHEKRVKMAKFTAVESESSTNIPGNESDKENWSPTHEATATIVKKAGAMSSMTANVQDRRHNRPRALKADEAENTNPDADDELAAFMRGHGNSGSFSGVEELDCVQGLLSLSQGRWAA